MKEREAIARLKQGDIGGLEELVRQYYVPAVRAAYLVILQSDQAEDIAQAAFLRVYERIDQFDPSRPFGPWFLRIVVNDARLALRQRDRVVPINSHLTDDPPLYNTEPALDEMLLASETTRAVWNALGELSPEQRAVIVLRYYLGLSESEMSSMLDCPPGTVKSRLHTAKQRLRQIVPPWLRPMAES